jgi:hypothetical protein
MKKILLFIIGLISVYVAQGQTVAKDWIRQACNGETHYLYQELDSENIVVLEFVMMDCSPCVVAANGIKEIIAPYLDAHPGKIRLYSIGFSDSYTCENMRDWQTKNGFTHPVFTSGQTEVAYYGGMGMPTIAIVANDSHYVFYKHQGFANDQKDPIKKAIEAALGMPSGINATEPVSGLKLYPNPVKDYLQLDVPLYNNEKIIITDITGRIVNETELTTNSLDVSGLQAGTYIISVMRGQAVLGRSRFIKVQ